MKFNTLVAILARDFAAPLLVGLSASCASAQQATLNPQASRITDEAIQDDYRTYDLVQGRIKILNDAGRRVMDYHLAKAQCWLDVSFHEYTRSDRSAFPQEALAESEKLIAAMEAKDSPISLDTPLVNGAAKLRPDLWAVAEAIKPTAGFRCAQPKVACAEVELVHAGNEMNQQGWRHAKPYIQIAEDLVNEAQDLASTCPIAAVAAPVAAPPAAPAAQTEQAAPVLLEVQANAIFAFDRSGESDIDPSAIGPLRELATKVANGSIKATKVRLIGHADRLNETGHGDYNVLLSKRRVDTVRELFVRLGVDAKQIQTDFRGDTQPVVECGSPAARTKKQLEACMLPNRRVQVIVDSMIPAVVH